MQRVLKKTSSESMKLFCIDPPHLNKLIGLRSLPRSSASWEGLSNKLAVLAFAVSRTLSASRWSWWNVKVHGNSFPVPCKRPLDLSKARISVLYRVLHCNGHLAQQLTERYNCWGCLGRSSNSPKFRKRILHRTILTTMIARW
jgi:hypothetical protein